MGRWFKFNLVHKFRVNRAEFNTKLFRVNELYCQDFHPVENSFGAVWMRLRLYKYRRHSNSRTGNSRLCHFTVEVCINLFTRLCFGLKLFKCIVSNVSDETEHIRPVGAKKQNKNKANKQQTMFIKTRLRITAYAITDGGIRMDSESSAKLSTNCWSGRIFFFCYKQCTFVIVETWSVGVFAFLVLKL